MAILDLTNRNVPQPHIAGSKNNELGGPHRDSDSWYNNNSYHYAETTLDNIIVPDNRLWEPDEQHIDELAASIETDGLLVPIGVKWRNGERRTSHDYRTPVVDLIYGYHRLAALKKLHAKHGGEKYLLVQTLVYSPALTKQQIARIESIENLMRRTPTATEKAKFNNVLTKYKANRLLAVLELARAPIHKTGSSETAPVTTIAKGIGITVDTLDAETNRTAEVLGVKNFSRFNPEKMTELATKVAGTIADIETDETGEAGKRFMAETAIVKKSKKAGREYIKDVVETATGSGRSDIVEKITNAETPSEQRIEAVKAADDLGLRSPSSVCRIEFHWPAKRIAAQLHETFGNEKSKEIIRELRLVIE
jgi:hypothetical protein